MYPQVLNPRLRAKILRPDLEHPQAYEPSGTVWGRKVWIDWSDQIRQDTAMALTYSTYEAKARFSEILRKVRSGERVVVSYHGKDVAEIRPVEEVEASLECRLQQLESAGVLEPASRPRGDLKPLVRRPGALQRFLDSRH